MFTRVFLFFTAIILSLTFSLHQLQAQLVPFYWEFINVDIAVQTNGDMLVSETQKYTFTGKYNNQRYRYIPLEKVDKITDVTVSENGKLLPSETSIENNQFWIRWQHQLNPPESHTFLLKYRVIGGLHIDNHDAKVYWKAIFADRKAPVKQAKVRVEFAENFPTNIKHFQSFGASGNIRKIDLKTIEAVAINSIKPGEYLGVQVTFDSAVIEIKNPKWLLRSAHKIFFSIMSGFFLFFIFGFLCIYSHRNRTNHNNSSQYSGSYGNYHYRSRNHDSWGGDSGGGGGGGGCGGCGGGGGGGG